MKSWVSDAFYQELVNHDIWTLAAFGCLQEGDVLKSLDPRLDLIRYLVIEQMKKCPTELYDTTWRQTYTLAEFIPIIKKALAQIRLQQDMEKQSNCKIEFCDRLNVRQSYKMSESDFPKWFLAWLEDLTRKDLYEIIWNHMEDDDKKLLEERNKEDEEEDEEDEDEEDEEEEESDEEASN